MTLVTHDVPNLIGGVSQQPPATRFATQLEKMDNAYPSPIDGMVKRMPSKHLAKVISGAAGDQYVHIVHRDETEQYVALFNATGIQVFDIAGNSVQVHKPGGGAPVVTYLGGGSATPSADFRALTIADFTFLLNTKQKVELDAALSPNFNDLHATNDYGFIFVRQAAYETRYKVIIRLNHGGGFPSGEYFVEYTTAGTGREDGVKIATQLASLMNGANWSRTGGGSGLSLVGYMSASTRGSVVRVAYNLSRGGVFDYLQSEDGRSNTALVAFFKNVSRYTDLPLTCYQGDLFEVKGDADVDVDNYWIKFIPNDASRPFGEGHWEQTVEVNAQFKLDASTMPHQLVRMQDDGVGTITGIPNAIYFEWGEVAWVDKEAGDSITNPQPSFVSTATEDRFITNLFLHKNRLGFLSGENIIFSGAGNFFNFWRTTVLNLLDGDPIDIGASHTKVAVQKSAHPFNERLITFSGRTQFVADGSPILTPTTAQITPVTEYESNTVALPVSTGRGIYFAYKEGDFSGLRELYQLGDSALFDASDASSHVPHYIPGNITQIAASSLVDVVICLTDDAASRNALYVYKYFWRGQEKVQSAWGRWLFSEDAQIIQISFIEDELVVVVQRNEGLFLEKIQIGDGLIDPGSTYLTHLDRRVSENDCVTTYDGALDISTITLPYDTAAAEVYQVVDRAVAAPMSYTILEVGSNYLKVSGDFTNGKIPYFAGVQYTMTAELSKPLLRTSKGGRSSSPVSAGRQQVKYGILQYSDSRSFVVRVQPDFRDALDSVFTPENVGMATVDSFLVPDGFFRFPVFARAREATITIINDTPWPCKLSSLEYETNYVNRAQRWQG